jgi:N-acetylglucosaminyl-diphospho-decaprenol L-rhamnosyltransferase
LVTCDRIADVAVLIVGYRNPADIRECLTAISNASAKPTLDVFICENGGVNWYQQLLQELLAPGGPCQIADEASPVAMKSTRFTGVQCLGLRARPSKVWVGCANDNLGYAGGINAWLYELDPIAGWKGVWVLNPDTKPAVHALAALVECAEAGGKGMAGSTIFDAERPDEVRCRGGLQWKTLTARTVAIGLGEALNAPIEISAVEAAMDSPSGASTYVTRSCLEKIGFMDERFFLFFEDLDWGVRAKQLCGLGYAPTSMVDHKRGTTTGTANAPAAIPRLSIYLEHRNGILFVRKHFPWTLPLRIVYSLLFAIKLFINRAPRNSYVVLQGIVAGLKGETGRPISYREPTDSSSSNNPKIDSQASDSSAEIMRR